MYSRRCAARPVSMSTSMRCGDVRTGQGRAQRVHPWRDPVSSSVGCGSWRAAHGRRRAAPAGVTEVGRGQLSAASRSESCCRRCVTCWPARPGTAANVLEVTERPRARRAQARRPCSDQVLASASPSTIRNATRRRLRRQLSWPTTESTASEGVEKGLAGPPSSRGTPSRIARPHVIARRREMLQWSARDLGASSQATVQRRCGRDATSCWRRSLRDNLA